MVRVDILSSLYSGEVGSNQVDKSQPQIKHVPSKFSYVSISL